MRTSCLASLPIRRPYCSWKFARLHYLAGRTLTTRILKLSFKARGKGSFSQQETFSSGWFFCSRLGWVLGLLKSLLTCAIAGKPCWNFKVLTPMESQQWKDALLWRNRCPAVSNSGSQHARQARRGGCVPGRRRPPHLRRKLFCPLRGPALMLPMASRETDLFSGPD